MFVRSPAFENGGQIPARYGCSGSDISIPLEFGNVPEGARSLALVMDDPDAPGGVFVHWVVYDIPPDLGGFPEAIPPDPVLELGIRQGVNDFGRIGYGGPCPPDRPHRYFIKLYALDTVLDLPPGLSKAQLLEAMRGHVLAEAEWMGVYAR
ncbi:YbhB/YbcL family Raf kinase inhibitor-like protein [Nitratifractor sp.]